MIRLLILLCAFSSQIFAKDILAEWSPTGSAIDGFTITHTFNGEVQSLIDVLPTATSHVITDIGQGVHILTIEGYLGELRGGKSDPATLLYLDKMILRIEVIE